MSRTFPNGDAYLLNLPKEEETLREAVFDEAEANLRAVGFDFTEVTDETDRLTSFGGRP